MEADVQAFMEKQMESQKLINKMFSEQMSFLSRMHDFTIMHEQAAACRPPSVDERDMVPTPADDGEKVMVSGLQVISVPSSMVPGGPPGKVTDSEASDLAKQKTTTGKGFDASQTGNNYSALELAEVGKKDKAKEEQVQQELPTFNEQPILFLRTRGSAILHWHFFEPVMGLLIVINSVNVGWAMDQELRNWKLPQDLQVSRTTKIIEQILLAVFTFEICLRIFILGPKCLRVLWNLMDFVLITLAYVEILVQWLASGVDDGGVLQQILVLRMFRILRLARAFRLVKKFRSLWNLCQGLMNCVGTMVSAGFLMAGTTFLFACFGAELITIPFRGDTEIGEVIEERFSTMPKILLTLLQFITMDSISSFYWPLILKQPVLIFYFLALLMGVSIALMNLVTAMLVEEAINNQRMDDEMAAYYTRQKLKSLQPHFRQLFRGFDVSGDGVIAVGEVLHTMESGMEIPKELKELVNHARLIDLFDALDKDQSGFITEDEFVEGLGYMAMSDVPLETMQILHLLRGCTRELSKLKREMRGTHSLISKMGSSDMLVRSV